MDAAIVERSFQERALAVARYIHVKVHGFSVETFMDEMCDCDHSAHEIMLLANGNVLASKPDGPHGVKVEVKIARGKVAVPTAVRVNGIEVPAATRVGVAYDHRDARRVTIELLATDVVEVEPEDWE